MKNPSSSPQFNDEFSRLEREIVRLDKRLAAIEQGQTEIIALLNELLDSVSSKKRRDTRQAVEPLSEDIQDIFDKLNALSVDESGRKLAENIINEKLADCRVTQAMVAAMQKFLLDRGWGIACVKCGVPSAPTWQSRRGGGIQFGHSTSSGGYVKHGGRIFFSHVTLLERPIRPKGAPPLR